MSLIKEVLILKKALAIGLIIVLYYSLLFLTDKGVEAATVKQEEGGSVDYSLLDDDGKTFVASNEVVFQNLSVLEGKLVDYKSIWGFKNIEGVSNSSAVLKSAPLSPGKYAITAKINKNLSVTSFVTIKASAKATKVKAIALPDSDNVDPKKSGKIKGRVSPRATVIIKNKTAAWTTEADDKGVFTVYVPAGTYDIIVDPGENKKNTKYSIKVIAGQNNSPFKYEEDTSKIDLGYEMGKDKAGLDSINPASKEYKGKAIPNSTVKAYSVDESNTVKKYTLIGETVTKKAAKGSTTGTFSIKLKEAQPGKNIKIVVEDDAFNSYSPVKDIKLGIIDPVFTPMKNAVFGKDVSISFADKSGALLTATDLEVIIEGKEKPLTKISKVGGSTSGDYKISSGKITISNQTIIDIFKKNQETFESDINFSITVKATGFIDSTFDQTIKVANAPSLTASVAKASTEGILLKASPTKKTDNKIYYKISSNSIDTPKLYSKLVLKPDPIIFVPIPSSPTDNIKGVDATTNKYLGIYELDGDRVVKFKQLTLTEKNIKPPTKVILSN